MKARFWVWAGRRFERRRLPCRAKLGVTRHGTDVELSGMPDRGSQDSTGGEESTIGGREFTLNAGLLCREQHVGELMKLHACKLFSSLKSSLR